MRFISSYFILIAISFFVIACDKKQQYDLETNSEDLIDVRVEPVIFKVNEDSLKTFTPGENGVRLPEVVKADLSNVRPYTLPRPITPGISYLDNGRKSKFPDTVKFSKLETPRSQTIKPKIIEIHDPVQIPLDSIGYFNNSVIKQGLFSIQNADTIYPPLKVTSRQPQPSSILPPIYKDNSVIDIKYLDVDQGLHTSILRTMLQDEDGNFWFGSYDGGLANYDGKTISTFTTAHGLSSNSVLSMLRDSNGNFWLGTFEGGVTFYDGQSFIHYGNDQGLCHDNEYINKVSVYDILEDRNGTIWFATLNGLSSYDGQSFTNYTTEQGLIFNTIISIHEDKKGNIWIGTQKGLSVFDGEKFTNYTIEQKFPNNRIHSVYEDSRGYIWLGTSGGLLCFDGTRFINYTVDQGLPHNVVISIYEDHSGNIWIGTSRGGLSKYNGTSFTNFTVADGLSNNIITAFLEDQSGNLWITSHGGVMVYKEHSFTNYPTEQGSAYNPVSSIIEDNKGNIWMATNGGGVSVFDGEKITNYTIEQKFPSNRIQSVYEDSRGNIWIGYVGGTSRINGEFLTHFTQAQGFNSKAVWAISEDLEGNMWFGTYNGVFKFDGKTFTHFTTDHGLPHYFVRDINITQGGTLIFATNLGGVSFFDGTTFSNYSVEQGLANNQVFNIHVENDTSIWFATNGGGVSLFNGKKFTNFTTDNGLSTNSLFSVEAADDGSIWLATKNGLNYWDSSTLAVGKKNIELNKLGENLPGKPYVFGKQDGLKGIRFVDNSVLRDSKNRMWWGSDRSLTMLELNDFKLPQNPPKILLRQIDINGKFIDFRHISLPRSEMNFSSIEDFSNYPQDLELTYHLNYLTFHFSAIDWSAPHKIKYSYKIEDLNDSWSIPTEDAKANYRNLPYGTHIFKVKAIGGAQKWSEPFEYSFVILPPWWHTWWARMLYGIAAVSLVIGIVRQRTSALNKRQKELKESEEKLRDFFNSISDVFTRSDMQGKCVMITPSIYKMTGYTPEELLGRNLADFYVDPNLRSEIVDKLLKSRIVENFEIEVVRKDGQTITVSTNTKLYYNEKGEPLGIEGVFRDITEFKIAEKSLIKSEAKYRSLVDNSLVGVFTTTLDGRFIYVNEAFVDIYKFDNAEQVLAEGSLARWKDVKKREQMLSLLQKYGEVTNFEAETVTQTGKNIHVIFSVKMQGDHIFGMVMDITDRKKIEEKLRINESELNEAQDLSRIGSWSWVVEKNVVVWSDTMYNLVGWDIKKSPPDFEENRQIFDPKSYKILEKAVERAVSFSEPYELDLMMVHRDGHSFNAIVRGRPVTDSTGKIIKLYGTVQDVTDRKRAESEHEKLFNSSFDLICIAGFDGYFKEVNPFWEQVTGYSLEELYTSPFIEFIHPDDVEKTTGEVQVLFKGKTSTIGFENRYITKLGKEIHLSWTVTPAPEEKLMYCIARDITDRKMAEDKIVKYQHRLKGLANELTITEEKIRKQIAVDLHDHVGQSLASMRMQMARITDMEEDPELTVRMKSISQGLLNSIQATRAAIFDLSPPQLIEIGLVAATHDWMKEQIEQKHRISTVISGENEEFKLDENTLLLLFRSIKELMMNIVKHAKASQLTMTFKRKGNTLEMTIEDDGIGFDYSEDLLRLKSDSYGLFSIQERISDLGGLMVIDSVIDKGTKVKLTVPLNDKRA